MVIRSACPTTLASLLLTGLLLATPLAPQSVQNPGFEDRHEDNPTLPAIWGVEGAGYEILLDSVQVHGGDVSLRMRRVGEGRFAMAAQILEAEGLRGQLVRLSGFIKTEAVSSGYAGLWLRIDGPDGMLSLDNMAGRGAVGTSDWARFQVEGTVGPTAERLVFGALMPGAGTAWFDDLVLETVSFEDLPPASDSALAYLNRALDLMQERSIRRDSIDWEALRASSVLRAGGAQDPPDTYPAIQDALRSLGDRHSFFMDPEAVEAWRNRPAAEASGGEGPTAEVLEGRYGYVMVPGFGGGGEEAGRDFAEQIQALIARIDEAALCGWIVDLRQNGGGNMWPMLAGLGPVLGEGDVGYFVNPDGARSVWGYADGASVIAGNVSVQVSDPYELRSGLPPVAVLTSRRTASSGEAIVTAFRARPDTRSFGEGTAGVSTSNESIVLSDGAMILLTTSVFADRTGRTYGFRIEPDEVIEIPPEGTPLAEDPVVLRAIAWLAEQDRCREGTR